MTAIDAGRAYLDRLSLAVDVRLVDDVARWPALAKRADQIVAHIRATTTTVARRVFDELSPEERLLHAVAQALGGKLDEREARLIHDQRSYTDRDVPFIAIVLAARGIDTPRAIDVYQLALLEPLPPVLSASLLMAFERGFPPQHVADVLGAAVLAKIRERWPDAGYARVARAFSGLGGDDALARLASEEPLLAGTDARVVAALAAHPARHEQLIDQLVKGNQAEANARLDLVARALAWRVPLPAAPIRNAIAKADPMAPAEIAAATIAAVGAGDDAAARRLCKRPPTEDVDAMIARSLALLGGSVDDVHGLWATIPRPLTATPTPFVAANAALFALELGDRAALRDLAAPLAATRATPAGRILLARIYLGSDQHDLATAILGAENTAIAQLLRARALAARDRNAAIVELAELVDRYPGWSEARLRLGLVLASVDGRRALDVLEQRISDVMRDSGVLGAPAATRAAMRLAAGELYRRAGDHDGARRAIRDALALAPASPLVARQAATLAVALRDAALALDAHHRLEAVTPGAKTTLRLAAGIRELAGDRAAAIAHYRSAGAWDRVVVLAARDGALELPPAFDVDDTTSAAALQAAAVAAVRRSPPDLVLAGRALERAVQRRPEHRGLVADLVATRIHRAREAIASGELDTLLEVAGELERTRELADRLSSRAARSDVDLPLRDAYARVVVAICGHWIRDAGADRSGLVEADARLADLHARTQLPFVALHAAALAIRRLLAGDATDWLARCDAGDPHAELFRALVAELEGNTAGVDRLRALRRRSTGFVASAARLLEIVQLGETAELAAWWSESPEEVHRLGVDAVLYIAYALAAQPGPRTRVAALLERAAEAFDADGARRARLVAQGMRATAASPEPVAIANLGLGGAHRTPEGSAALIAEIDLGQLDHADERELAIGLVALEARRRRRAGDTDGANAALARLVMLARPTGANVAGMLARISLDDAGEAALAAWRASPDDALHLQGVLATQLRHAIDGELAAPQRHVERLDAWRDVIGLLGPVLVGDRAWRALAARRGSIYRVAHHELASARDACGRRIADILAQLAKWHAANNAGPEPPARLEEVRQLLATELSIARTMQSIMGADDTVAGVIEVPLGPLGLDLLGRRADAIEALAAVTPGTDTAADAADVRGILVGALLEGWVALHEGRFDVAERIVRERIGKIGHADAETTALRGAIYVRRMREALEDEDLLSAADIAETWSKNKSRHPIPEELAGEIVALCDRLYARYKLSRPRRLLQTIRANHDARSLREAEADLIARHLDDSGRAATPDQIELCVAACALAPARDDLRRRLYDRVTSAVEEARTSRQVDDILALLRDAPADSVIAAQVRRSVLGDKNLTTIAPIEARIEELRHVLDRARTAGVSIRAIAQRLAMLHEQLVAIYLRGGNQREADRHERRAHAYDGWSKS